MDHALQRSGSCADMHTEMLELPILLANLVYSMHKKAQKAILNAFAGSVKPNAQQVCSHRPEPAPYSLDCVQGEDLASTVHFKRMQLCCAVSVTVSM